MPFRIRRVCFCAALAFTARDVYAQSLPPVPTNINGASKVLLDRVRASLVKRGEAYDAKGPDFLAVCGPGKIPATDGATMALCTARQAALTQEIKNLEIDEASYKKRVAPWTNVTVVDSRGPMDGAYLSNQNVELRNSPAVGEINKGFAAVINHDWKVALAWWQQAQLKDPNNQSLARSIELAQWMVDRAAATRAGRPTPLSIAMKTGSSGNWERAIEQFEAAKAENPAIAPLADHMIEAYKSKIEVAAYWRCEAAKSVVKLIGQLSDDALAMSLFNMEAESKKTWALVDSLSVGLEPVSVACRGQ